MAGTYATKKQVYKGFGIHYIGYMKLWKIAHPDKDYPDREYYFLMDYDTLKQAKTGVNSIIQANK
jgi:hypothetical protein